MYFIARTTLMQQYQRQIPQNPSMTKKVVAKNYCQCAEYRKKKLQIAFVFMKSFHSTQESFPFCLIGHEQIEKN